MFSSSIFFLCWIAAKLAFQPPPQSYNIYQEGSVTQQLWIQESYMQPGKKVLFDPHLPYHLVTDIRTRRRSTLVGLYLEHPNSSLTIIFSHGNAVCYIIHLVYFLVRVWLDTSFCLSLSLCLSFFFRWHFRVSNYNSRTFTWFQLTHLLLIFVLFKQHAWRVLNLFS